VAIDTDGDCLALLNKGVYGSHYENGSLYMSLLRGVTYCAHPIGERLLIPDDRFTAKIDQGENNFSFRLTVAKRDSLERKALEFVEKPYALNIFPIPARKQSNGKLDISVGGSTVSVNTVKKAFGKDAVIFRLVNNSPRARDSYLKVNDACIPLSFGKYEVKTVVLQNGKLEESYEMLI
jgi:alpha-mannosidase